MLIISKLRYTSTSEMSSPGAENGRCHITAYIAFWDFGYKVKCGRLTLSK
jgi:hypothetical protein